jgi:transposase
MDRLPDLTSLSHDEKDALIYALWAQVQALTTQVQFLTAQVTTLQGRVAELDTKLGVPPKTPDNSSLPPSRGKKPNRGDRPARNGPRQGSIGREGGGRLLAEVPDETVTARPARCAHCEAALGGAELTLAARFDKVDLPKVTPVVTRVERYAGHCRCCGATTLAPPPWRHHPGAVARGAGTGHAVQRKHCRAGDVPAFRPPRQLPPAQPPAARAVRPGHQRRRARRRVPARQAPLRRRDCRHPGPLAPGPHRQLGRSEALLPTGCASTAGAAGTGCSRTTRW